MMEKQKNIPVLRFPEFSGNWEKKKLGEIAEIKGGKRIPKGFSLEEYDNGFPYITVSDMENGSVSLCKIRFVPLSVVEKIRNYKISSRDIYISVAGTLGLVGIIPKDLENANLTENANKITKLKCDQHYLLQYLKSDRLKQLVDNVSTVGAQPKLAIYAINDFIVTLHTLPEQQKIGFFLTEVDNKLQALKKKKTLLEQYKKGVMQKIFSREIRFKDDNGKEFPKWEKKKLGDITVINPKSKSLPCSFIYIDLESVVNGVLLKEEKIELNTAPSRAQRLLRRGDVLFQMVRPYQKNNLYFDKEGAYVASTGYAQIRTLNYSKFIFQYLHFQKFVDKVIERCTGTSYPSINSTDLANISINLPRLDEQTKIANFLSAIDEKINLCTTQIEKTEQYKKGLLQKMFV